MVKWNVVLVNEVSGYKQRDAVERVLCSLE